MFESLRFRHTCPGFLLSKFASQIKLIQSVEWGLVTSVKVPGFDFHGLGCQGPMSQCLKSQLIRSQFQGRKFYGLESRVLGSRVSGLGSQVSGPGCRLCHFEHILQLFLLFLLLPLSKSTLAGKLISLINDLS